MRYETIHWTVFNVLARLFGLLGVFIGAVYVPLSIFQLTQGFDAVSDLLVSAFALVVGIGFVSVRPYRPDLSSEGLGSKQDQETRSSWWTGKPMT